MRKILISILLVLLILLTYSLIFKNITISKWASKNLKNIETSSNNLNAKIATAKQKNDSEYPQSIEELEKSIKNLKVTKEKYKSKTEYIAENVELGVVPTKEYKIERLWIVLENYAKKEGIELKLDIKEASSGKGKYDLDVTLSGEYIGITDFLYDIEKDDTLGFKVLNFKIQPMSSSTSTTNTNNSSQGNEKETKIIVVDASKLKATFTIEDVGINFD